MMMQNGLEMRMADDSMPLRKLSREEVRLQTHLYWSRKTIPERLAAATALTKRLYRMRGIDLDEQEADYTPRRVSRRQG